MLNLGRSCSGLLAKQVGRGVAKLTGRRWRRITLVGTAIVAALLSAFGYGVVSHRYELFPFHHLGWLRRGGIFDRLAPLGGYNVSIDRRAVPCNRIGTPTLVLVTLGQSNAANSGEVRFGHVPGVYNFNLFDGRCFEARDPLLGAGGDGGSVWMPLARQIVESGLVASVVIAPIGLGGTRVEEWAPGGALSSRFDRLNGVASRSGLHVHAILWHQGESNRGTDPEAYRATFLAMVRHIRGKGLTAPLYVARATRCGNLDSRGINQVQAELGLEYPELGLRPGPDTDKLIGPVWRDGCHFTSAGLARHAGLWFEILAGDIPELLGQSRQ